MDHERADKERGPRPEPGQRRSFQPHLGKALTLLMVEEMVSRDQDHPTSILCAIWWVFHCKQFRNFCVVLEWESALIKV